MRHLRLGRDEINLDKFEVIQLSQRIQNDSINCGVYCLKVSKTSEKIKCLLAITIQDGRTITNWK